MINYQNSKIYIIKNNINNLVYIGATTELYLSTRYQKHKSQKCSIGNYINNPDNNTNWNDWYIELYENYPCNDKNELNKKEGEIQRLFKKDNNYELINKKMNCNKSKEESYKEWIEANKERLVEKQKIYRENNKQMLAEKQKIYREDNKQMLVEKNYYYNNRTKLLQHKSEKVICECGCEICKGDLARHKKTQKHFKLMEQLKQLVSS